MRTFGRYLSFLLFFLLVMQTSLLAADNYRPPEKELLNSAYRYSLNQEYEKAVETYEKLLSLYPDTRSEEVYRDLANIYENKLFLFSKAVELYRQYLDSFPHGRLSKQFQEKLAFLLNAHQDWDVLRGYRYICDTYHKRENLKNIAIMEGILKDNPNSFLAPEIYNWLSWEYHSLGNLKLTRQYVEKYIETFSEIYRPVREKINAYEHYVLVLTELHQYKKALNILEMVHEEEPVNFTNYGKKVNTVIKERTLWYGVVVSYGYIILLTIFIFILKPWKRKEFRLRYKYIIKNILLLILFTIGPMVIVNIYGYGVFYAFPTLAVAGSLILIMVNLLSPLAQIYNKKVYLLLSILLIIAVLYVTFYKWDNLSIFYTPLMY